MKQSGNGNGKPPTISVSTLVKTTYNGGDLYETISQLLERRPTGTLTLFLSQGGLNGLEFTERPSPNYSFDRSK